MEEQADLKVRQEDEKAYFSREKWPFPTWIIDEEIIPWNMRAFVKIFGEAVGGLEELDGKRVLDCGCGWGVLAVLLARRGAHVTAVDIAPECVEIARKLTMENGVSENVDIRVGAMEALDFEDEQFDIVVGTRVLHHVDIDKARWELARVLKKGGVSVFWECTYKNRPYNFVRNLWRRFRWIPISGTKFEHPLTREEVGMLDETFGRTLEMHAAPYVIFTHLAGILTRGKLPAVESMGGALDRFLNRAFPFLQSSSFHQILVARK